jgi:hypothetical protein
MDNKIWGKNRGTSVNTKGLRFGIVVVLAAVILIQEFASDERFQVKNWTHISSSAPILKKFFAAQKKIPSAHASRAELDE